MNSTHTWWVNRGLPPVKVQTTLFSPKVFQVGVGRNSGVGGLGHAGEVTNEKAVGKTKSK